MALCKKAVEYSGFFRGWSSLMFSLLFLLDSFDSVLSFLNTVRPPVPRGIRLRKKKDVRR